MTARMILKPGREKSVRLRHPWVFAGALESHDSTIEPGSTVDIFSHEGEWLARGSYNAKSQIAIRIWTWKESQAVDSAFFRSTLAQSIAHRRALSQRTNAMRLVNAENDGLPGLIIDRYGAHVVVQFLSAGAENWRQTIVEVLREDKTVLGGYERSDADIRIKEGLEKRAGSLFGDNPPEEILIHEDGLNFSVDVRNGHKTGFYLDQRENRAALKKIFQSFPSRDDLSMLNAFSYTGAFSIAAKKQTQVRVTQIDSSATALEAARHNYALNTLSSDGDEFLPSDVFEQLRSFREQNRKFDMVILDPPKFAFSKQGLLQATRAYKDINWLAMRLLKPGGLMMSFSCSGLVSETLFQQIVFAAATDAGRNLSIVARLGQATDHPVRLTFPEGSYLKGFLLQAN
jgi:23S rRNA (cytosine1962-C5)-methyltransferase